MARRPQSLRQALSEAFGHRSYVLLVLGFFTCGFQLAFVTVHCRPIWSTAGCRREVGGWTIAVIGLFNIIGSLASGWLGDLMPKRYILSVIYFGRALADRRLHHVAGDAGDARSCSAPSSGCSGSRPCRRPSGLVALMFGTRWLAMLFGFAFFSHQVGGFLGVWLGGLVFERTGSYDVVWWLSVLFGVLSAVINLPIVEKPVRGRLPPRLDRQSAT